jgi:hypothetical protein
LKRRKGQFDSDSRHQVDRRRRGRTRGGAAASQRMAVRECPEGVVQEGSIRNQLRHADIQLCRECAGVRCGRSSVVEREAVTLLSRVRFSPATPSRAASSTRPEMQGGSSTGRAVDFGSTGSRFDPGPPRQCSGSSAGGGCSIQSSDCKFLGR